MQGQREESTERSVLQEELHSKLLADREIDVKSGEACNRNCLCNKKGLRKTL